MATELHSRKRGRKLSREKEKMRRTFVMAALAGMLMVCGAAVRADDEGQHQEISAQGTGFFTKDSTGDGVSQHSTDTGGFVLSYRYHFNSWLAADASYGYVRNTQENFTSNGQYNVQANVHQATGALVVTFPRSVFHLRPYVLAGAGALVFDPTGNAGGSVAGASRDAKAAFVYGGGVDYSVTKHLLLRAEYRGFVYSRSDFGLPALNSGATTHTAEPSAGVVVRF
jgi:opacity protein-like surface antigen